MQRIQRIALAVAVFAALAAVPTFSSNTATLRISVTVPKTVAISVESTSFAADIDFSSDPKDIHLGTVREMNNSLDGYVVYLTSENARSGDASKAYFTSSDAESTSTIPYVISYGGVAVEFTGGTARVSDNSGSSSVGGAIAREVRLVSLDNESMPDPGSYNDTLTFTIASR